VSVALHKELLTLRRHILSMGASVEDRVREAIDALFRQNLEEARRVRTSDDEIDAMDLDIEKETLRLLALTQPVAADLRFILAVMRINTDLERIADMAKSIAKRVLAMSEDTIPIDPPPALRDMAERTQRMLSDALAALANNDAALCNNIRRSDDQVDDLLKEVFAWAQVEIPQHVEATPTVINLLSIARKLERIADMSTNIAEDVIFIVSGEVVRHGR
jgi:phosphate transport system protein